MLLHEKVAQRYLSAKTLRLYHGTTVKAAESILQHGFDLRRIKPRWVNDYAVSTLTSPKAIQRYFGERSDRVVLGMVFTGHLVSVSEARDIAGNASTPQEYTASLLRAGVDAVVLEGSGSKQVFVYNTQSLTNIQVWTPTLKQSSKCVMLSGGDRGAYRDSVWEMYEQSYRAIGMHLSSPNELFQYDLWYLCMGSQGNPVAFTTYENTPFGRKSTLAGHDGSSEGKSLAVASIRNKFKESGIYGEVSHKVKDIALSAGAPVVCAVYAGNVLQKPITIHEDGVHYTRNLRGVGSVTKVMLGNPRGIPTTDGRNPVCPAVSVTASAVEMDDDFEAGSVAAHFACLALSSLD